MQTLALSWLYGILSIASWFISVGMSRLWWERMAERRSRHIPWPDRYLLVVLYAGLHGFGGAIWWTLRAWDAVVNDRLNIGTAPWAIIFAAILYAIGKGGLVFASALNGKPAIWRIFLGVCLAWSGLLWWDVFFNA